MTEPDEVVDAELVVDDHLPARLPEAASARPMVDQHTILYPGQPIPTEADQVTYTERDLYVSPATAERLEKNSKPENTDKNQRSQRDIFEKWCKEMGRVPKPCTTATFVEYVASMIESGYRPNTISAHMSAIRTWMPEDKRPNTRKARKMLNEYRKKWAKRNRVKKAPAITDDMLRAMVSTCDPQHPIGIRDRCALLLGRGALNRRIELADLGIADVDIEHDGVALWIAYSKTDQEAEGEFTFVPTESDPLLDPIRATQAWMDVLYGLGLRSGPFFRALTTAGTLQSRARATKRGDYLKGDAINNWVRERARLADLPNWHKITSHGLRRGGAQAIMDAGGDPTDQGRWKQGSKMPQQEYGKRARARQENAWFLVQEKRKNATDQAMTKGHVYRESIVSASPGARDAVRLIKYASTETDETRYALQRVREEDLVLIESDLEPAPAEEAYEKLVRNLAENFYYIFASTDIPGIPVSCLKGDPQRE